MASTSAAEVRPAAAELRGARGFTLIEAMIALAIVALGMIAVHMQLGRYAQNAARTEEKTLASWIATNKITELSVQKTWPELGKDEEDIDFAGRAWHYTIEVLKTPADNLRRVDVSVYLADRPDVLVDKVSGFIEPPLPPGFGAVRWLTTGGQRGEPGDRSSSGSGDRPGGASREDREGTASGGQREGTTSGQREGTTSGEREGTTSGEQSDAPPGALR